MLSHHHWSGIQKDDVDRWIGNFYNLSDEDVTLAYTLLINIIYYSESDIITALKEGINNFLFKSIILQQQISSHFTLSPKSLVNIMKEELNASCFIPLLDKNAPYESANSMIRLLVQNNVIQENQAFFLQDLRIENNHYKRVVIIDDCVGSGDQLWDFWNKNAIISVGDSKMLLRDYCTSNTSLEVYYLTLFGYSASINDLQSKMSGIKIFCVNLLTDDQRVFSKESYFWQDKKLSEVKIRFSALLNERGIPLLGYRDLDFALIMDRTIPDWSLPMLYKETPDWKPLLRRKSTI